MLPWVAAALEDAGAEMPEILPNVQEAPIEAIAEAAPDLIIAVYSGITDAEYDLLSQIAPTVAYPDAAWSTPWRTTIEVVGESLGKTAEASALLGDIDAAVAEQADAHPELEGKSVAMVWDTGDSFYVYKAADSRVAFTLDLGLVTAESVEAMGQVKRGTVAEVVGTEFIAAVSPPTALSLTWGLEKYVEILSGAAMAVDAG